MSDEEKKVEEQKDDGSITLKSKGDWRELLSENLQESKELLQIESLDDAMSDYLSLKTKVKATGSVEPVDAKESSDEAFLKASETILNVKEDQYAEDFAHKDIAYKYKLPARLVEPFVKDMTKAIKDKQEAADKAIVTKNLELIKKDIPEGAFDVRLDAGLNAMGITRDEYKKIVPEKVRTNPELVKAITKLGIKQYTAKQQDLLENNQDTLPSDPEVLKSQIATLAAERLQARMSGQATFDISEKLKLVKLKYNKVTKQKEKPSYEI